MESGYSNERPILRPSNHNELVDYIKHATDMTNTDDSGEVIEELSDHFLLWMSYSNANPEETQGELTVAFYDVSIKARNGEVVAELLIEDRPDGFVGTYDADRGHAWFDDGREVLADQAVGDFMARWRLRAHMQNIQA